jgi:hypothetical protein
VGLWGSHRSTLIALPSRFSAYGVLQRSEHMVFGGGLPQSASMCTGLEWLLDLSCHTNGGRRVLLTPSKCKVLLIPLSNHYKHGILNSLWTSMNFLECRVSLSAEGICYFRWSSPLIVSLLASEARSQSTRRSTPGCKRPYMSRMSICTSTLEAPALHSRFTLWRPCSWILLQPHSTA